MEPARAFRCCRVNQPSIRFWAVTIASSRVPVTLTTDERAKDSLASGKWILTLSLFLGNLIVEILTLELGKLGGK